MSVKIEVYGDNAELALWELRKFANGMLGSVSPAAGEKTVERTQAPQERVEQQKETAAEVVEDAEQTAASTATSVSVDTRPVGQPAEGNKRRNSAEKAEDDQAEALATAKGIPLDKLNAAIQRAGRVEALAQLSAMADAGSQAAISTGENRVGPDDEPEAEGDVFGSGDDSDEDAAQDAADEAAETEANGLAPIEHLRRALGAYQKKFGMAAAVRLMGEGGAIGQGIDKLTDDEIATAIETVNGLLRDDGSTTAAGVKPNTAASDPGDLPDFLDRREKKPDVKPATIDDLKKAMLRYADKFDGQSTDMNNMPQTMAEMPKLFQRLFGEGVTKVSQVPADGYGKAVAAIDAAIAEG